MNSEKSITNYLKDFHLDLSFHFSEELNIPLAKPYWIYISLSHKCNFSCQMCGVRKILKEHELDLSTLKKALSEVASWNSDCVIMLTGGEPFLRKDIFEIIDYAVFLGLKIEAVTNGSLIDNSQVAKKIIESGLQNIAVSLDGVFPQTHDQIRGIDGAFKKALDGISYLSQEKRIKGSGPQISVWTTIMKENVKELYEIIFLVKSLGVECLVYHPVIVNQDDMQSTIKSGLFWVGKDYISIFNDQIDRICDYQRKNGLVAFLHDPYLWLKYFKGTLTRADWKCNPFVFIDIGPDGYVRSCGPAFGNIKQISLDACLNSNEARMARERMQRCQIPCLQTCWARPEADSLIRLTQRFINQIENSKTRNEDKGKLIEEGIKTLIGYENLVQQKI